MIFSFRDPIVSVTVHHELYILNLLVVVDEGISDVALVHGYVSLRVLIFIIIVAVNR
jgi:hypothetical protein